MVALKAGARYRLECYVRTKDLITPEGPRLIVTKSNKSEEIASSDPIAAGTSDWQRIAFEFVAPADGIAHLSIKRTPRFSYDDPTSGVIWFDDFDIKESGASSGSGASL